MADAEVMEQETMATGTTNGTVGEEEQTDMTDDVDGADDRATPLEAESAEGKVFPNEVLSLKLFGCLSIRLL